MASDPPILTRYRRSDGFRAEAKSRGALGAKGRDTARAAYVFSWLWAPADRTTDVARRIAISTAGIIVLAPVSVVRFIEGDVVEEDRFIVSASAAGQIRVVDKRGGIGRRSARNTPIGLIGGLAGPQDDPVTGIREAVPGREGDKCAGRRRPDRLESPCGSDVVAEKNRSAPRRYRHAGKV